MADLRELLGGNDSDSFSGAMSQAQLPDNPILRAARGLQGLASPIANVTGGAPVQAEDFFPQIPRTKKELALQAMMIAAPSIFAMIPTKKNLPAFQQKMAEARQNLPNSLESIVQAFMEARYPMRMRSLQQTSPPGRVIPQYVQQTPKLEMPDGQKYLGLTEAARDHAGNVLDTKVSYRLNPDDSNYSRSIKEAVSTLAHETEHSRQYRRNSQDVMDADRQLPYRKQEMERRANQAGSTAATSWQALNQLLRGK